jgi:hypothetical protein
MQPALSAREMQIEMLRKVKEIPGLNLDRGHFGPQVSFAIELVNDPLALHKFKVAVNATMSKSKVLDFDKITAAATRTAK